MAIPAEASSTPACLMRAWQAHAPELRRWLMRQALEEGLAQDWLQEVFLKAMRQGAGFCDIANARAWLFEVARNTVADHLRRVREMVALPEELPAPEHELQPVDQLAACLPRVLMELRPEDREALTLCDLEGLSQEALAARLGLSLSAAKSRVQRARKRLKAQLASACQVRHDASGKVCCLVPRPPLPASDDKP